MPGAQIALDSNTQPLIRHADEGKLKIGSVVLIFDCNRHGHDHRHCAEGSCTSYPSLIWEVDEASVTMLPFSSTVRSALTFEPGEGGLMVRSYLQPQFYWLPLPQIGPVIGMIEPKTILRRISRSVPPEEALVWLKWLSGPLRERYHKTIGRLSASVY